MPPKSKAEAVGILTSLCGDLRSASELVFRATRALILSHFETAEEKMQGELPQQFYGAAHGLLWSRLHNEGVSKEEWGLFKQIWKGLGKGIQLNEAAGAIAVNGKRTKRGVYANGWPGIFALIDALLADATPRSLLTDWYRHNLCTRYEIEDTPEFRVFATEWIERFNGIDTAYFRRRDLLTLVPDGEFHHKPEWAEGFVEALDYLALLQFSSRDFRNYALKFKADLGFVLTNLFGRSTGVEGLDYLFFGGLSVSGKEKLTLVVSGAPGMGKSTLALSMGAQVAARGGLCLFFRFEEMEGVIRRQLAQYHRNLLPFFDVASAAEAFSIDAPESAQPPRKGRMIFSDIASTSIEEIQSSALRLANSLGANKFGERVIIFDSLNAAVGYGQDIDTWRKFIVEISAVLRAMGYVVIFLLERAALEPVSFEEYVTDVDIRLGHYKGIESKYPFRVLEIRKSRWQPSHRGEHVYSIEATSGMNVFPSSAAIMSARRKREARVKYSDDSLIDPGVKNFVTYLNGVRSRSLSDSRVVGWWRKGSVTALIGTRGSLKTEFAHQFTVTPDRNSGVTQCSLSLHFADEFHRTGLLRENQRPSPFGVRYDIPLGTAARDHRGSTLSFVLFRPGFLASGHVLHTVREIIAEKRKSQTPIRRAVISDAGNIASDFPALKEDQAFLLALCDLLASEGITTIIVYSTPEHGGEDFVVEQVKSASENILRCASVSYAGRVYSSISVERSADSSHDHGVYEIRKASAGQVPDEIEVAPTFDLVLDPMAPLPTVAKVKILLHAGGTELQRNYNWNIKEFYKGIGAYDVTVMDHAAAFMRQGGVENITAVERALWLVQVEAGELPLSKPSHRRESVLSDLSLFPEQLESMKGELAYPIVQGDKSFQRRAAGLPIRSIPYFLNPSFLVVGTEFRDFALNHPRWHQIGLGMGSYSWDDLITAALEFRDRNELKDHVIFDFPAFATEALNCLFLEILSSLSSQSLSAESFPSCFNPESAFLNGSNLIVETVRILRKLAAEACEKYYAPQIKDYSDNVETDKGKSRSRKRPRRIHKAIIWRHWYSSFRQMAADMAVGTGKLNPGLNLLRLPGNVWTNGDWHFAILEGSVGVRQGIEIILDKFVNKPNATKLMTQGVGLPPFKDFYLDDTKLLVTGVAANWFLPYVQGEKVIYRSLLGEYRNISPLLRYYLASMVREACDDAALESWLMDKFFSMNRLIERSLPA
jgi:KaiC/GvpD/RAD55 family RecA-like ATPase